MGDEVPRAARRRRRVRHRVTAAALVAVAGAATGVGVAEADSSGGTALRTSVAEVGSATRTLTLSGTLEAANQAQASFQASGTVQAVDVSVGQHVDAGQTLATLDPTSLQQQVSLAQADLASAQQKLVQDESGQASATSSSGTASTTQSASANTASAVGSTPPGQPTVVLTAADTPNAKPSLQQAQQAVVEAQHTADLDAQTAAARLDSAETACTTSGGSQPGTTTSGTPGRGSSGGSGPTASPTTTSPTTTPPGSSTSTTTTTLPTKKSGSGGSGNTDTVSACTSALQSAMASEQRVSRDQQQVQRAEQLLAKVLTSEMSSLSTGNAGGSTSAKPAGGGSTSSASTTTDSAAQLASDQASIDSDQASLVSAQQELGDATLSSPISGTVAAVGISVGQSVSGGSSSDYITVTNQGAYQAVSSLTSSQVGEVSTGDRAELTVDGLNGLISGTVGRVGPVDVSSTTASFPMVVSLAASDPSGGMHPGSAVQMSVQIAHVSGVVVVPTSAVHTTSAGNSYVTTLESGRQVRKPVKTGVVGKLHTQITSGLSAGAVVVLADPSQAVPSSSTNSATGRFRIAGLGRLGSAAGGGFPSGLARIANRGGG